MSVLLEAAKIIGDKNRRVFDVLHLLEKALPHLPNLRAEDIVAVVEAQHEGSVAITDSGRKELRR